MFITTVYIILMLTINPYLRRGDDQLHLLSQIEVSRRSNRGLAFIRGGWLCAHVLLVILLCAVACISLPPQSSGPALS
jgi:hypothetical protein